MTKAEFETLSPNDQKLTLEGMKRAGVEFEDSVRRKPQPVQPPEPVKLPAKSLNPAKLKEEAKAVIEKEVKEEKKDDGEKNEKLLNL